MEIDQDIFKRHWQQDMEAQWRRGHEMSGLTPGLGTRWMVEPSCGAGSV